MRVGPSRPTVRVIGEDDGEVRDLEQLFVRLGLPIRRCPRPWDGSSGGDSGSVRSPNRQRDAAIERAAQPDGRPVDLAVLIAPMTDLRSAVRSLLRDGVALRVVIVSDEHLITGAALLPLVAAGADGWLPRTLAPEAMARTLIAVHAGEPAIARRHVMQLLQALRRPSAEDPSRAHARLTMLTPRERQIFLALADGASTASIAEDLSVSENTIRWHTARIVRKLGVSSRADLLEPLDGDGAEPVAAASALVPGAPLPVLVSLATLANRSPSASPQLVEEPTPAALAPEAARGLPSLAPAELRVVLLAAEGMTNQQIATALFLSKHTVASHLKSAFVKLGVRSRVELTRTVLHHESARQIG